MTHAKYESASKTYPIQGANRDLPVTFSLKHREGKSVVVEVFGKGFEDPRLPIRLGYEVVGSHLVSPRGVPVEHTDLELRRESFRSPVPVEIVALDPLLPLFGAA